nr:hypothetical protein [Tanacetum cinerariifolium]
MAELLRAPTERYAEAIVVPLILAEQFELKHSLINMMTSDQFFRLEKDNPHDHIRWFNKITSTIKYKDVLNSAIKLMLFPFSLAGVACRTTNLRNEISNFQQRFDESFHEAWDRCKDLLRACPHHGFTKLHQLNTFYNALNPSDQDSLNVASGGNLFKRRTQDVLKIIENKSKVRNSRSKSIVSQLKACDVNSNSSSEIAKLTHAVNQQTSACLATGGNTFPELRDNIQGYISAAAVNYNQGNPGFRPLVPTQQNQNVHLNELEKVRRKNEANIKAMQTQIDMVKNELRDEMKIFIQTSLSNQTNEIKNMMASLLQMNIASTSGSGSLPSNTVANPKGKLKSITTRSGLVIDGPIVRTPHQSINPKSLLILGRPFLQTAHALIDVHDLDSTKDLHPPLHDDLLSSSITFYSNLLPEEFANELVFPLKYDDDLQFDIKSDLKEIEFLLYQDVDSSLTASIDYANPADNMFTDEHALDYSSPPIFDEYDEFLEIESDAENVYDDPFDFKGEKIKESKLLIDELDIPCDFLLS